jgi:predicted  nucleic acid-binding Zn-ribbon protein
MSASLGLYRLQQVDRQIDRAQARLEAIRKILENDTELKQALNRQENALAQDHRAVNELKNAEAQVDAQKIKIEQTESSLYGGSVKNPKELQDLQKDIESLKKHLGTLEERELEAMIAAEAAGVELQNANAGLEAIQSRLGNEHKKLIEEQSSFAKQLESLSDERGASLAPITSDLLQMYEDLRKQKRGVAVSEVEDSACASCGTNINPALQQNARSQKLLAYCPSCGRILFAN